MVLSSVLHDKLSSLYFVAMFVLEAVWSSVGCVLIHWKRSRNECTATDQLYIIMCGNVAHQKFYMRVA